MSEAIPRAIFEHLAWAGCVDEVLYAAWNVMKDSRD
jgi:hypothetical protein